MPEKTHATQELILAAAIEALEESGPSGATTRAIAERAGVNVAAINYYFRSKDNLLALAAEAILDRLFEWDELEDTDDMDIRDRLVYGLNMLAEGFVNCPKPVEGLLSDIMLSDMNAQVLDRVRAFMRRAVDELCALDPERPRHAVETNVRRRAHRPFGRQRAHAVYPRRGGETVVVITTGLAGGLNKLAPDKAHENSNRVFSGKSPTCKFQPKRRRYTG